MAGMAFASAAWHAAESSRAHAASAAACACACAELWTQGSRSALGSRRRVGWLRRARVPPRPPLRRLLHAADYFLLAPYSTCARAAFCGCSLVDRTVETSLRLRGCTCFSKDFALRTLKTRKNFRPRGADRTSTAHRPELALQTRQNRPKAELVEPAERLLSCSRSKKSVI